MAVGKIAVGMSGGVDSSVAASLLVDRGYEVIGLTAHMWKEGSRCCSIEDVERARKVAWHLGIKHFVLNAQERFTEEVVDPFVREYLGGRTPSPCVKCNQKIKFGFLLTRAVEFGCEAIATGHYAVIDERDGLFHLRKARDLSKDQSYFLHRLNQRQLAHVVFPMADLIKSKDVVSYIEAKKLPVTSRGESQDLCFVPEGHHGEFIERLSGVVPVQGPIVDSSGRVLGKHDGIHRYTVGQRRGLGVAAAEPLYVTEIDVENNRIVLGPRGEAMRGSCVLDDVSWTIGNAPDMDRVYNVRVRYQHSEAPAHVEALAGNSVKIVFEEPQFAVCPGQAGVIYDGDEILGGGWIS